MLKILIVTSNSRSKYKGVQLNHDSPAADKPLRLGDSDVDPSQSLSHQRIVAEGLQPIKFGQAAFQARQAALQIHTQFVTVHKCRAHPRLQGKEQRSNASARSQSQTTAPLSGQGTFSAARLQCQFSLKFETVRFGFCQWRSKEALVPGPARSKELSL